MPARKGRQDEGRKRRLSLYPLAFEDALANLIAVKPAAKGKKAAKKPKAASRKAKKRKN